MNVYVAISLILFIFLIVTGFLIKNMKTYDNFDLK